MRNTEHEKETLDLLKDDVLLLERTIEGIENSKLPPLLYVSPEGEETLYEPQKGNEELVAKARTTLETKRNRLADYERFVAEND